MRKLLLILFFAVFGMFPGFAQDMIHPDSTRQAWEELERRREMAKAKIAAGDSSGHLEQILLGDWVSAYFRNHTWHSPSEAVHKVANLEYKFRENRFYAVEKSLEDVVQPNLKLKYQILLAMQRWDLDSAKILLNQGEEAGIDINWVAYQQGKIGLWEKRYQEVLAKVDSSITKDSTSSLAWLLKAEAAFWLLDLETAEEALIECLTLDPFNADARFWYGYAIWRKRDAQLLDEMAAQWELALAIHPLHYLTHWHWGNGHTNMTFADYYDPQEEEIRKKLLSIDSLPILTEQIIDTTFNIINRITEEYPESVIPIMYEANFYYFLDHYFQSNEPKVGFQQAQNSFQKALELSPHYGPAHNGLAAVIKSMRIYYLPENNALESGIFQTKIDHPETFYSVFPDVKRYPGDRVAKMVYSQLHTGVAYLDMLDTLGRTFAIPPLHEDLSIAMNNPWFRGATTFDNRQWMDIRGVGSGATGIEYVERGSHLERNVTLHEYVHLFHGTVLTDQEQRRIRELYEQAMANDFTLDYYARNNEYEYFAQGFPAYFSEKKVHPLNHKSVNTRSDLLAKDPDLYAFIDSMVQRQRAYLAGDPSALASNWAQTYLRLTDQALVHNDLEAAEQYANQAYQADSTYLPTYFAQVKLAALRSYWAEAERWFDRAEEQFPGSPQVARAKGNYMITLYETGLLKAQKAAADYLEYMREAISAETDDLLVAEWQAELRKTMFRFARWDVIVTETESYLATGDTTSTYLRDLQDDARADVAWIRGMMGYGKEAKTVFDELLDRKPQNLRYRVQYAEVLSALDEQAEVVNTISDIRDLYIASGNPQPKLEYLLATNIGQDSLILKTLAQERIPAVYQEEWATVAVLSRDSTKAADWISQLPERIYPQQQSRRKFLAAISAGIAENWEGYEEQLIEAVVLNPFNLLARSMLITFLEENGKYTKAARIAREGQLLPILPGPDAPEWARYEISTEGEE